MASIFKSKSSTAQAAAKAEEAAAEEERQASRARAAVRRRLHAGERRASIGATGQLLTGAFGYLEYENAGGSGATASAHGAGETAGVIGGSGAIRSLADCTFALNRQGDLLAVPLHGSVLDVLRLPLRFRSDPAPPSSQRLAEMMATRDTAPSAGAAAPAAQESLEGARVCYLLNLLHGLLHPNVATDVRVHPPPPCPTPCHPVTLALLVAAPCRC